MIGKDSNLDISVIRYEWGVATSKRDIRIEVCVFEQSVLILVLDIKEVKVSKV